MGSHILYFQLKICLRSLRSSLENIKATLSENVGLDKDAWRRLRSACAFMQSDQNLLWVHSRQSRMQSFCIQIMKTDQTAQMRRLIYLFVLRFYGPVNPMGSCRMWSVYLTTRLLCTFFRQKLTTVLLESAEGRE